MRWVGLELKQNSNQAFVRRCHGVCHCHTHRIERSGRVTVRAEMNGDFKGLCVFGTRNVYNFDFLYVEVEVISRSQFAANQNKFDR